MEQAVVGCYCYNRYSCYNPVSLSQFRIAPNSPKWDTQAMTEPTYTQKEAAAFLGVNRRTVYRMIKRGQLWPLLIGGRQKFLKQELERVSKARAA